MRLDACFAPTDAMFAGLAGHTYAANANCVNSKLRKVRHATRWRMEAGNFMVVDILQKATIDLGALAAPHAAESLACPTREPWLMK